MSKFSVGFSDVLYETKRAGDSRLHNPIECWRIKESGKIIGYIKNRDQAFAIVDVLNAPLYDAPPIPADKVMVPILNELKKATKKFPTWPTDPLHALAVLGEEFGELTKAMLQWTYEPHKTNPEEIRTEAIQTAAMAIRLFMSLDVYKYNQCEQHSHAAKEG